MINRKHIKEGVHSCAVYSDCECYRYSLTRIWERAGPRLTFIMLNPSTASEVHNDPTIHRCEQRARTMGFGSFCAVNIFALRATDPRRMRAAANPEGPDNREALTTAARWADRVIAAWGVHGQHRNQGQAVASRLRAQGHTLYHIGQTKAGHPRHPLYLPYSAALQIWTPDT